MGLKYPRDIYTQEQHETKITNGHNLSPSLPPSVYVCYMYVCARMEASSQLQVISSITLNFIFKTRFLSGTTIQ